MIKVERNLRYDEISKAKKVLQQEKLKKSGNYNKEEVLEALKLVFSSKCYICENKKVTSYNIEHYKPHKDKDIELKFSWENLFLACAHCNNIKLGKYENILNCCEVDVDELIYFKKHGNFSWEEQIEIKALHDSLEVIETVKLLDKVYNGTTTAKKMEAINIKKELRLEIQKFMNIISEYYESRGEDKVDAECLIIKELKSNSPFTAFKRWIVRDNKDKLETFFQNDKIKSLV